jgi:hypothetical protein
MSSSLDGPQARQPQVGRMTAVMRTTFAVSQSSTERIPRIAVVRGGRIIDEHLVREAVSVTVGTSETARIVVPGAPGVPASFQLLERAGGRYWLRFTDAMSGRVVAEGVANTPVILSLSELRVRAHVSNDGAYRVPLSSDARGKIIIGDTTFLFQIVPPPPIAPTPRLPLGVKNAVSLDWSLTIIAAFSFLLHFGIAGALYSDWLDPTIVTEHTVSGIVDDLARLPKPAPELAPDRVDPTIATADAPTPTSTSRDTTRSRDQSRRPTSSTSNHSTSRTSDSEAAALAARAEQLQVDLLGARAAGPSVQRALDATNIPAVDLSAAAEKNVGVTHDASNGLKVTHGGPIAASKSNLPGLAGDTRRNAQENAGTEGHTPPPPLIVGTQPPSMTVAISDADRVIASLRARFRKCYESGLHDNAWMSGKATIVAKVAPNGEVHSAEIGSNEGLSPAVTSCLTKVVSNAQFTGNGSVTTLRIPVTFVLQK